MIRPILSFFSVLAIGAVTAALIIALMPWMTAHAPAGLQSAVSGLQFESLVLGLLLGLSLGTLGRFTWSDIPRRVVTWFLVRERLFFYYTLVAICAAVIIYY